MTERSFVSAGVIRWTVRIFVPSGRELRLFQVLNPLEVQRIQDGTCTATDEATGMRLALDSILTPGSTVKIAYRKGLGVPVSAPKEGEE
jgi:hypothetical protein